MKKTIALIFKSLIKNSACVEGGREKPWFFAVIFYFLSLIIAVIPTLVNISNSYGASFIPANNYNMDNALASFAYELNGENPGNLAPIYLRVNESAPILENVLTRDGVAGESWAEHFGNQYLPYVHTYNRDITDENGNTVTIAYQDYEIYFFPSADSATLNQYVTNLLANKDPLGISYHTGDRSTSFLAFGRYTFKSYVYKTGTAGVVSQYAGNYEAMQPGTYINDLANVSYKASDTETIALSPEYFTSGGDSKYYTAWQTGNFDNWKEFYNVGFVTSKNTSMWVTTLTTFGVFALLGLFMGLVVFLITRGKNNPFRYFTFWDSMKIGAWAMLSPAILTLILGFIMSSLAMIGFIVLLGMRIMWMSMRTLKPQAQ